MWRPRMTRRGKPLDLGNACVCDDVGRQEALWLKRFLREVLWRLRRFALQHDADAWVVRKHDGKMRGTLVENDSEDNVSEGDDVEEKDRRVAGGGELRRSWSWDHGGFPFPFVESIEETKLAGEACNGLIRAGMEGG